MYCLVNVDDNGKEQHLTRSECEGFKKCFTSNAMRGTEDNLLWSGTEEDGNARS